MTEPKHDRHNVKSSNTSNTGDQSRLVTAARRHGNLETIRKQPGWKDFPDCIPLQMRMTKSGKVTEFGNTKLRIVERIAVHTNLSSALTHLKSLTEDGTRMLSLKDLERCAAHFDISKKAFSKRGSSSAPVSTAVSHVGDDEPSYQSLSQPLDTWNQFSLDQTPISSNAGPSLQPLKRPSPESFQSMSVSPLTSHPKRPRMDTFLDPHTTDFLLNMPDQDLNIANNLSIPRYQQQNDCSLRVPTPSLTSQPPSQNPARALLSIHPHAGSIFSNLNTAFDDLLARVEDQQQLVKTALDQLRMATNGLEVVATTTSPPNNPNDRNLDVAQRKEVRARHDLQQARSARDVIDVQYGHIGTSLSRALVDTVRAEYTRAEAAMSRAQADVESVRQRRHDANNQEQALRRAQEVAEVGIDQLQRQTRFWLKRLAEAGVKLTDQLGTLQGGDAGQASS